MKVFGSEITPHKIYLNRRQFVKSTIASVITSSVASNLYAAHQKSNNQYTDQLNQKDTLNTLKILNEKLSNKIYHCYDSSEIDVFLEDYVYYAMLLITLYEVDCDELSLKKSISLRTRNGRYRFAPNKAYTPYFRYSY